MLILVDEEEYNKLKEDCHNFKEATKSWQHQTCIMAKLCDKYEEELMTLRDSCKNVLLQSDDSYVRAIGSIIKERLDKVIERKTLCFKRD